ncbi:MAG: ergothioneine biosynthesis protein EgtB [Caulobacteraceae bacterium]|nr:MAG: ergothioneine biosynthesis protein EgtB [Caulobacteraceae bacterium]
MAFDTDDRETLAMSLAKVRQRTLSLAAPLSPEDMQPQAMPDASPTKWHLAHTTWFFDEFILRPHGYAPEAPTDARFLFNSYYEAVGERAPRPGRGLVTRPGVTEILDWRLRVDEALQRLFAQAPAALVKDLSPLLELGLNHEEQHQELLLMDILALFALHPGAPAYRTDLASAAGPARGPLGWITNDGGLVEMGAGEGGFAFDCERPRQKAWVEPFALGDRLVTCGEWLGFMRDGGYETAVHWLSDGWDRARSEGWRSPAYWDEQDGVWTRRTLAGREALDLNAPVCHVSYYEADAYARWAGARLPTEAEWEAVAGDRPIAGNFMDSDILRAAASGTDQLYGDVWEWTASAYSPYRGFVPAVGAVGEYNGKFMSGRQVLRGGACVTPARHMRASYRNFFEPHQRWMFSGVRLAKDCS